MNDNQHCNNNEIQSFVVNINNNISHPNNIKTTRNLFNCNAIHSNYSSITSHNDNNIICNNNIKNKIQNNNINININNNNINIHQNNINDTIIAKNINNESNINQQSNVKSDYKVLQGKSMQLKLKIKKLETEKKQYEWIKSTVFESKRNIKSKMYDTTFVYYYQSIISILAYFCFNLFVFFVMYVLEL